MKDINMNILKKFLTPLLLGLVAAGVGAGLAYYYSHNGGKIATLILYYLLCAAGAAAVLGSFYILWREIGKASVVKRGTIREAEYVAHDSDMSVNKQSMYRITYKYTDEGGVERQVRSGHEYDWEQALAFRCAETFEIMTLGKRSVITEDAQKLFEDNRAAVEKLDLVYRRAYKDVSAMYAEKYPPKKKKGDGSSKDASAVPEIKPAAKDDEQADKKH